MNTESAPMAEKVTYYFGERPKKGKINMPAVEFTWYDAGHMFYLNQPDLLKMRKDLVKFLK